MQIARKLLLTTALVLFLGAAYQLDAVPQEDVVGYWTINLEPGFNLVAFPVLPDTPSLDAVIGDRLGAVEITTWDRRIGRYRWARYNPEADEWSGDLFILNRGVGYWINLLEADGQQSLRVVGRPESYTQFKIQKLGTGWKYFGPTIGKGQQLNEIPPARNGDLLINWNNESRRFELAEGMENENWYSPEFRAVEPDNGYIVYQEPFSRDIRRAGPPTIYEEYNQSEFDNTPDEGSPRLNHDGNNRTLYDEPPYPLIVSNREGLAVCYANGEACGSDYAVNVVREDLRLNVDGEIETFDQNMGRYEITGGGVEAGKFRIALTISEQDGFINPGDRVYMLVEGPNRMTTRSTSFEIPYQQRFLRDIDFPDPLTRPAESGTAPQEFTLSKPFPNPFNDRFMIEFNLPETAPVEYKMFDLRGREVYGDVLPMSAGRHRLTISSNNLAAGIYLLEVKAKEHRGLAKVAHLK